MRRAVVATVLVWALLVAFPAPERAIAQPATDVDPAVLAEIAADGDARVIVELNAPALLSGERADRARLRDRIAAAQDAVLGAARAADVRLLRRFAGTPGFVADINAAGLQRLAADPRVASIVIDRRVAIALNQSVALTNADDTRDTAGLDGAGITVAVIDTGSDTDHPDLSDDVAFEVCYMLDGCPLGGTFDTGPGSAEDDHGHGSHVAGIITSKGVVAPKGIAPATEIGVYKVADASGSAWLSDMTASMSHIIANHPEVKGVNMSLSDGVNYPSACDAVDPTMTSAVSTLRSTGTLTFVASGNDGYATGITWPACVTDVISVGAVWDYSGSSVTHAGCTESPVLDTPTCFSNSGPDLDLLAPGAFVLAPHIGGGTATRGGTSMASPHALGVAVQLWDADPSLTPAQIEATLEGTGVPRLDPKSGLTRPRVDAWAALIDATDGDGDLIPGPIDNCPDDANPLQENYDRNFIDLSPPKGYDDVTRAMSDGAGDACDTDDDNDGRTDAAETAGTGCGAFTTPTNPLLEDHDGDRVIDGWECTSGTDPASAGSAPSLASCHASGDADADSVFDSRERCYYGTLTTGANSDGDTLDESCEIASINADLTVNVIDLQQIAQHTPTGGQAYLLNMDINRDGAVNVIDLQYVAARSIPCP